MRPTQLPSLSCEPDNGISLGATPISCGNFYPGDGQSAISLVRKMVGRIAFALAVIGLAGFALPSNRAEAGILTHIDADEAARNLGATLSVAQGGIVGAIGNLDPNLSSIGSTYASGVVLRNDWVITADHVATDAIGGVLTFRTYPKTPIRLLIK